MDMPIWVVKNAEYRDEPNTVDMLDMEMPMVVLRVDRPVMSVDALLPLTDDKLLATVDKPIARMALVLPAAVLTVETAVARIS